MAEIPVILRRGVRSWVGSSSLVESVLLSLVSGIGFVSGEGMLSCSVRGERRFTVTKSGTNRVLNQLNSWRRPASKPFRIHASRPPREALIQRGARTLVPNSVECFGGSQQKGIVHHRKRSKGALFEVIFGHQLKVGSSLDDGGHALLAGEVKIVTGQHG